MFGCSKYYPYSLGLSTCFRQWRADSHCAKLHGYALAFKFDFEAETLDDRNWVLDFGSMKPIKAWLQDMFDHKLLIANDDPERLALVNLGDLGLADVFVLHDVGCEAFAKLAFDKCERFLIRAGQSWRVKLVRVTVSEHEGNSASCSAHGYSTF